MGGVGPRGRVDTAGFLASTLDFVPTLFHALDLRPDVSLPGHSLMSTIEDGTAIGLGLGTAVNRLRSSTSDSKVVVLVTDGSNNAGQLDPRTAAELARDEDITVHTVLVGRGGEVPIPVWMRDPRTGREFSQIQNVEVDINPDGSLDQEPDLLARLDVVVGSVHSELRMPAPQMTARMLHAVDIRRGILA